MRLNKPKQNFVLTCAILSLALAGFIFGIWLETKYIITQANKISKNREELSNIQKQREELRLSSYFLKENHSAIQELLAFFVDPKQPIAFIKTLEKLALLTNTKISIPTASKNKQENILNFSIALEGEKNNVLQYLKLLELLPYDISINDISINRISPVEFRAKYNPEGRISGATMQISITVGSRPEL